MAFKFDIARDYYLYRSRIHIKVLSPNIDVGKLTLPPGTQVHDAYLGDQAIYHGKVAGSLTYTAADHVAPKALKVAITYQGCHEVAPEICYPPHTEVLTLPGSGGLASVLASVRSDGTPPSDSINTALQSATFGNAASPSLNTAATGGRGSMNMGLVLALLLALAGGLILNLMPCVLPVLAIKAVGVLEGGISKRLARRHALAYAAGIITSFLVIGGVILVLRSAGQAVGWGTQLQQPWIVAILACVLFTVGLTMSGLLKLGSGFVGLGESLTHRSGSAGHFFTGVLAVVVATPCTAPFMGAALAYALVAPPMHELLVMLALGTGLALPLAAIGLIPALGRLLPKPGAWMVTLKHVLAFPMYLSAVWLVWVLAHQRGADAVALVLISMVVLAAAAGWHSRSHSGHKLGHVLTLGLLLAAIAPVLVLTQLPPVSQATTLQQGDQVAFSTQRLNTLRQAGTPVFVAIGADWCVTCKVNEHAVLNRSSFRKLLTNTGTVYMQGDWTDVNTEIAAYLKRFHSPGVPLYVMYPRGAGAGIALPTLLTASIVENAVRTATR